MEALWLLAIIMVPVAFVDRDYLQSEAVISYVEVPKIAILRTLAALMAVLWLVEWGIQGHFDVSSFRDLSVGRILQSLRHEMRSESKLILWLRSDVRHWLFLAVWVFLGTTLLTTILSGSPSVSLWGEVPGQDGYAAYTIVAYVVVFGVIATHLKTSLQLWRILGALIVMGVLVSGYAIFQHYGGDFLNLTEVTGGGEQRVTTFMGNAIFGAAVMMMTIPMTLVSATASLRIPSPVTGALWIKARPWAVVLGLASFWGVVLSIQLLGLTFTFSRGPWLGTIVALVAFIGLAFIFVGWRPSIKTAVPIWITLLFTVAFLQGMGSASILGTGLGIGILFAAIGVIGAAAALAMIGYLSWANISLSGFILRRMAYLAQRPIYALAAIVLAMALVAALVVALLPSSLGTITEPTTETGSAAGESTTSEVAARFNSIGSQVLNGFGTRGDTWKTSWRLIRDRPWFEFDNLSLGWLRPLIGYGPDMFRYTYLLESRPSGRDLLPEEPDHAHNYLIHQTVEQGFLGLLSALGVMAAVAGVGAYILIRRRDEYSTAHKLILVALLAVMAGRLLEMMVGVARVSDLTILWVLLGVFAALPNIGHTPDSSIQPEPELFSPQAESRAERRAARRARSQSGLGRSARQGDFGMFLRLAIVAWIIGGVLVLTWVRTVNNVQAGVSVGNARASFREGDFQSALNSLDRAIDLAPDISLYHNHRAAVYLAYQINQNVTPEHGCSAQRELPYNVCLAANSFQSNLNGNKQRPFYFRSHLSLANSAYNLPQLSEETVNLYREVKALVPGSWLIRNELAEAYLAAGRPREAIQELSDSLALTKDHRTSAGAHYLQGIAYQEVGDLENAAPALERVLELQPTNRPGPEARALLPDVYLGLNQFEQAGGAFSRLGNAQQKDQLLEEAAGSFGQSADAYHSAGTPLSEADSLYKQGEIYAQLNFRDRATSTFHRAVALDDSSPSAPEAYRYLAGSASRSGDIESALAFWMRGADAHTNLGNLGEAALFLTQALQEEASSEESYSALVSEIYRKFATTRQELGERDEAPGQLFLAGAAAAEVGDLAQSSALYLETAALFEQVGLPGRAGRSYYLGAVAAREVGQLQEAAAAAQRSGGLYKELRQKSLAADSYFLAGELFLALAQFPESAQAVESSLELDPDHSSAAEALEILTGLYDELDELSKEANALFRQGVDMFEARRWEESVEVLERSLAIDFSPAFADRAHQVMAEAYLNLQKPDLAAESFFLLGAAQQELGQLPEAAQALERGLELDSSSVAALRAEPLLAEIYRTLSQPELMAAAYFRGGEAYRDLGEPENAAKSFERSAEAYAALGQSENEARSIYQLGLSYLDLGRLRESAVALVRSVDLDGSASFTQDALQRLPNIYQQLEELTLAAESLYVLGVDLYEQGFWALAARDISRSLELDSSGANFIQAHEYLVDAYTKLGLTGGAGTSLLILANGHRDSGDLDEAVDGYERVVSLPVTPAMVLNAYRNLGDLYRLLGNRELEAGSLLDLGRKQYEFGNWEDSIQPLERSIEIYMELDRLEPAANANFYLGLSVSSIGRLENAVEHLERSVELDSSSENAPSTISTLASFYHTLGRFGIAAETYFQGGLRSLELGDPDSAVSLFRSSLSSEPDGPRSASAHQHLAEIFESRGDIAQAAEHRLLAGQ